MPLRLVIGPAGSGKTHWCLEEVRRLSAADPDGPPLILLVPEQASYQTEQAFLRGPLAGTIRVRVFSFARLAQWVFSLAPASPRPRLGDIHRRVLATSIIANLRRSQEGGLLHVRSIEQSAADFLAEMKQFRVTAASLADLAQEAQADDPRLARKLEDLALVAREYENRVHDRFEDPEDTLASLRGRLTHLDALQGARVYLDGFYGFTPVELEVLRGLMARCSETVVTLLTDPERFAAVRNGAPPLSSSRTYPTEETLEQLLALAADDGIALAEPVVLAGPARRFASSGLKSLEARFLKLQPPVPGEPPAPAGLRLLNAADARDEARLAVEQIADWRAAHGWRWGEMAIVTRSLEDYAQPLDEFLRAFGVPFFLDRHEPLATHPVIQGTLAALSAVIGGYGTDAILEFAKSGLYPWDIDAVARLEEYAQTWPPGRERWLATRDWQPPPGRSPFEDAEPLEADEARMRELDALRRAILAPLLELDERLTAARDGDGTSAAPVVAAVCDFLRAGVPEPDEGTLAVLQEVGALFDALIEAAGTEHFEDEVLLELIREALGSLTLPRIPPAVDQVICGQADRTRLPAVKGVVVLGLAEGHFPMPGGNASLLTDRERDLIHRMAGSRRGRDVRASARRLFQREGFFALVAMTRASDALTLVRPLSGSGGEALARSPYWEEVRRLFPALAEEDPPPALSPGRVRRGSEAAAVLCRDVFATTERGALPPPAPLTVLLPGLPEREQPGAAAVLATAARRNDARLDPELARAFIGDELRTSVSALESFAACPFQYFMRSMIAPQVAPGPAVTAADIGNLAHAVLKAIADELRERGAGFGALVPDEIDGVVHEAMERPLRRLEDAGLFKSRRERAMAELLRKQLVTLVAFLADAAVGLGARTLHAEVRFGPRGALAGPRISVPLASGEIIDAVLRGQIDRVDQWTAPDGSTWLAVLDYKLTERKMDWAAAADGMSLQLAGYLLVLGENAEAFGGEAEHPPEIAGAFYVPVLSKDDKARKFRGVAPLSAFDALELGACGAGARELLSGDPKAAEKSPSRGDVLSDAQFAEMMQAARKSIARHARSIASGEIAVNPAVLRRTPPCGYCDFQAACRLDYSMNSRRSVPAFRQADAINKWLGPAGE